MGGAGGVEIRFDKIYLHPDVLEFPLAGRILSNLPGVPSETADDSVFDKITAGLTLDRGKRILRLTAGRGDLVKPCPGTQAPYLCCRYTVVNQQTHCPMDCTYCVLQAYLSEPAITVFVNLDKILLQIQNMLDSEPDRFFRIGTGELTDSLALDPVTRVSGDLLDFFALKRNALLELKTKTDHVKNLLDQPVRRAVVSWSVNPGSAVDSEEILSADLESRLAAARKCADAGFLVGFHLDPILHIPDWEAAYRDLIFRMFSSVDPSRVAWISLGSLRFPPALKNRIESRFPTSRIVYKEMIRGLDGKMRYPKPMRVDMYRRIYGWIREASREAFVYFCMESPDVWERVMGAHPSDNKELDYWFMKSLRERFPELGIR
jgi:spore photoproduct lyase